MVNIQKSAVWDLRGGPVGKNPSASARDVGAIPCGVWKDCATGQLGPVRSQLIPMHAGACGTRSPWPRNESGSLLAAAGASP